MSTITTLTLTVGFAIIKHMLSDWAGDGVKSQIGQDLLDLCRDGINDWTGNKSERNQIDQMGERIVATMTPLWKEESRTLPENSKAAIVLAVANTLAHARIDPESIIQHRLDAERMAKNLAREQKSETVGFSRDESALYLQLLSESCRQIIYVANHLNGYVPLMDRFKLLTLEQILTNTECLISGAAEQAREYEAAYQEQLPNQLNKFELIGINYAQDAVNRQKLQRAYVNLRLERSDGSEVADLFDPNEIDERIAGGKTSRGKPRILGTVNGPIQEILALSSRLVIRGAPGSGKSTLLRWLAMSAAKHELSNGYPAIASWDDALPFYLRLRSFRNGKIPNPLEWAEHNVPNLALNPPTGWMYKLLKDGRALVLIDGVDEVPDKQRATLLENLDNLIQTYPLARYLITSRPAAIKDWPEWTEWSRKSGFSTVGLQEMELEQSFAFIDQWHDALAESLEKTEDKENVVALKQPLKQLLRQKIPLRKLAGNPLLCTMICALHRERPKNMPQNRVKLYQDCVELLLYKRDTERGVSLDDYPELTYTHEEVVLRDYAHHLMRNGESEESFEETDNFFDQLLRSMHMPGWTGALLRDYFLQRSGLLIEPADSKIAFAHRTFQEYLAAREIVKKNDIGFLLDKARDDQWHETIMLTVSIPEIAERQSERLFKGLLKKAEDLTTPRNRHELILLAVACMESPLYLSQELRQRIIAEAAKLIPPKNPDEVARIAKAGDPMVEFLRYNPRFSYRKMARCVDALIAIGSEHALNAIIEYVQSPLYQQEDAHTLRRSIGSGLLTFDPTDYCSRVLKDVQTLDLSSTHVSDAGLPHLAGLRGLTSLNLSNTQVSDAGLPHLAGLRGLTSLDIRNTQVSDVGLLHLAELRGLTTFDLSSTQVSDAGMAHLARLSGLTTLNLKNTQVSDAGLPHLVMLSGLTKLSLSSTQVSDAGMAHLVMLSGLTKLSLSSTQVSDAGMAHLAGLSGLTALYLRDTQVSDAGLAHLTGLSGLQSLSLWQTKVSDAGLAHLAELSRLQTLDLMNTQVSDAGLAHLAGLSKLQTLDLMNTQVSDAGLAHLAGLSRLQSINLSSPQVSDAGLAHLAGLSGLQSLYLSFTQVSDAGLAHLAELSGLQSLDLMNTQVSDAGLAHLASLSGLQSLYLMNTQVSDAGLAHLAGLSGLQTLNLKNTKVSDAGLAHLAGLSGLTSLDLRETQVKDTSALDHLLGLDIMI